MLKKRSRWLPLSHNTHSLCGRISRYSCGFFFLSPPFFIPSDTNPKLQSWIYQQNYYKKRKKKSTVLRSHRTIFNTWIVKKIVEMNKTHKSWSLFFCISRIHTILYIYIQVSLLLTASFFNHREQSKSPTLRVRRTKWANERNRFLRLRSVLRKIRKVRENPADSFASF